MPRRSQRSFTVFGPRPGIASTSVNVGGTSACSRSKKASRPVVASSAILSEIAFPTPAIRGGVPAR
jgi:hypothetical protein